MNNLEKNSLRETVSSSIKKISLASCLLLSTLSYPTPHKPLEHWNYLWGHPLREKIDSVNSLKQVSENMYVSDKGWIYLLRKKPIQTAKTKKQKKEYVMIDEDKAIAKNDLISLDQQLEAYKDRIKGIYYLSDLEHKDRFDSNLFNFEGKSVFVEDLLKNRLRLPWNNKYEQLNLALMWLEYHKSKDKVIIELNDQWGSGLLCVLRDDAKQLADSYEENIKQAKLEIDTMSLDSLKETGFKFQSQEDETLAKIYAYIVKNIKYGNSRCSNIENQSASLTLITKEWNCDWMSKIMVSLAKEYGIQLKKETGLIWDAMNGNLWGHAWVSLEQEWKKYIFDPTNERYTPSIPFQFGNTNFFKVPEYISKHFYQPMVGKITDKQITEEDLKKRLEELQNLNDSIQWDKENNVHYFLHNDTGLSRALWLWKKQTTP